jgi:hypothetical protein
VAHSGSTSDYDGETRKKTELILSVVIRGAFALVGFTLPYYDEKCVHRQ